MELVREYGWIGLDVLVTGIFLLLVLGRIKNTKVKGLLKGLCFVAVVWGVATALELNGVQHVAGTILQFAVLGVIILYPYEFRSMMAKYGRKRFGLGKDHLLSKESRVEVIKAVATLSREKRGCLIAVATTDGMEEAIETGKDLGSVKVSHELIESIFRDERLNKGAMIIKDDRIVSVNSQLPVVTNDQLDHVGAGMREFAGLGAVYEHKAVSLMVNRSTGKMSMMGYGGGELSIDLGFELKERNVQAGVTEEAMVKRLDALIKGTKQRGTLQDLDKPAEPKGRKKAKTREEKMQEREQKREARQSAQNDSNNRFFG